MPNLLCFLNVWPLLIPALPCFDMSGDHVCDSGVEDCVRTIRAFVFLQSLGPMLNRTMPFVSSGDHVCDGGSEDCVRTIGEVFTTANNAAGGQTTVVEGVSLESKEPDPTGAVLVSATGFLMCTAGWLGVVVRDRRVASYQKCWRAASPQWAN
jgi:hypothetical protein